MRALLKNSDCNVLRNACIVHMRRPGGDEKLVKEISITKTSDDLFDLLVSTPYLRWIDIRLLEMMAIVSENSQARQLLKNYKAAVFSKRLNDIIPNLPSEKVNEMYYCTIITKLNVDHHEVTVAYLLKVQAYLEEVILGIGKGISILKDLRSGCIEAHWYIPSYSVNSAYQNTKAKSSQFNDLHLQHVRIRDHPQIFDPLEQTDHVIT